MSTKPNIRSLSVADVTGFFTTHNEKAFRAKQVMEWLWAKSVTNFEEMSNLPKTTRELLASHYDIHAVTVSDFQKSNDGTLKNAFKLFDGNVVEGVLIPTADRMT